MASGREEKGEEVTDFNMWDGVELDGLRAENSEATLDETGDEDKVVNDSRSWAVDKEEDTVDKCAFVEDDMAGLIEKWSTVDESGCLEEEEKLAVLVKVGESGEGWSNFVRLFVSLIWPCA